MVFALRWGNATIASTETSKCIRHSPDYQPGAPGTAALLINFSVTESQRIGMEESFEKANQRYSDTAGNPIGYNSGQTRYGGLAGLKWQIRPPTHLESLEVQVLQ